MSERELVTHILSGHEPSLHLFYKTHSSKLTAFVRKRIGEEKDVEEIVQDTFMACLEAFRDFTFACSLSTFLCSIAKRKVVDFYRKKKLKRLLFSQFPQLESILSVLTTPEDALDEKLLVERIETTFGKLAPRYTKVLRLKYVEGLSVEEIARDLSTSFKSVESMLFRARRAFSLTYAKG
jgi:RNA polymerase sigma-70 factor, ECF subfamily